MIFGPGSLVKGENNVGIVLDSDTMQHSTGVWTVFTVKFQNVEGSSVFVGCSDTTSATELAEAHIVKGAKGTPDVVSSVRK